MAWRELTSVGDLLPGVLARLARSTGDASHLRAVWEKVAGPTISRRSDPLCFEGDTLVVSVADSNWARELRKHEPQLRARLSSKMPELGLSRLEFRESPCRA